MEITTQKLISGGIGEGGLPFLSKLELPVFSLQADKAKDDPSERINGFYDKLSQTLRSAAEKNCCTVLSELRVTYRSEDMYSLYINIFYFREKELIGCRRVSDTRGSDGIMLLPPKKINKHIPKNGGWYYDGKNHVVFENLFKAGDGAGVRRSQYGRFFGETKY